MPAKIKIKGSRGTPIQTEQPNSFTQDSGITDKEVFNNDSSTVEVKSITLTGDFIGISPGTYQVVGGDATIEVDIQ